MTAMRLCRTASVSILMALTPFGAALAQNTADPSAFYGGDPEVPSFQPAFEEQFRAPILENDIALEREVIAGGLTEPWGLAQMPDGRILVTEQAGRLVIASMDGTVSAAIEGVPEVDYRDQGGLLDVAIAPDFEESREIYLSFAELRSEEGQTKTNATSLARGRLSEDESRLESVEIIFRQQPAWQSTKHFGSRIVFQDNDHLWLAMGERSLPEPRLLAQNVDNTIGTVVRLNRDGSAPDDNPLLDMAGALPEIWSYGHRNVQSASMHPETGALWTIEHGPQGGDEVNLTEPGVNYGWPTISYGEQYGGGPITTGITEREGLAQPNYYWSPVIAPSGGGFYTGEMFPEWQGDYLVGGLVPQLVVRLDIEGERVVGEGRILEGIGRVRDIEMLSDGSLLVATDYKGNGELIHVTRGPSS